MTAWISLCQWTASAWNRHYLWSNNKQSINVNESEWRMGCIQLRNEFVLTLLMYTCVCAGQTRSTPDYDTESGSSLSVGENLSLLSPALAEAAAAAPREGQSHRTHSNRSLTQGTYMDDFSGLKNIPKLPQTLHCVGGVNTTADKTRQFCLVRVGGANKP